MDAQGTRTRALLDKVGRYPAYDERSIRDTKSFAVADVMWHLAKDVRICTEVRKRANAGYDYGQFCETLTSLLLGSLHAALLADVDPRSLAEMLDGWNAKGEVSMDPLKKGREHLNFPERCERVTEEVLLVLELTRSSDIPYQDLQGSLLRLIEHVLLMANMFGYSRQDFERLVPERIPGLELSVA